MVDHPKTFFVLVFLLLGIVVFAVPVSPEFFGYVHLPSAELLNVFKPIKESTPVSLPVEILAPAVSAASVMVYDPLDDRVIFEKKSNQEFGIASITKIVTVLVAYDRLGVEEKIRISQDAVQTQGIEGDLRVGEHFMLRDLVSIMLISSSNDAAAAIAEHIGRLYGAVSYEESQLIFVHMMNEYVRGLGFQRTVFRNPTGLDIDEKAHVVSNTSTTHDLAFLMKHAYNHPSLQKIYAAPGTTIYSEEHISHTVNNTNELLVTVPGVVSGKTGFTDGAGGALVTVAEVPFGKMTIIVVLGSTREGRFTDTAALLDWLRNLN